MTKQDIITLFNNNIKNKSFLLEDKKHCGSEGYWLENMFGIKHNNNNNPDLYDYELKKYSNKITLGDFSASEYLFSKKNKRHIINNLNKWSDDIIISRTDFIHYFGNPNSDKNNRYSWSGSCVPKYNEWNNNGQNLLISDNNDIIIYYSYLNDKRESKINLPDFLKNNYDIIIAIWSNEKLKKLINNKFNKNGFFLCKKINNIYQNICFGKPFTFEYFIECIKNKKIIFDSGMYDGNNRNYSQFRGTNFWNELIIEEY